MSFSERMGIDSVDKIIQMNSMNDRLKTRIWNLILDDFLLSLDDEVNRYYTSETTRGRACVAIWKEHFIKKIDEIDVIQIGTCQGLVDIDRFITHMSYEYKKYKWNEVYDFLQFIIELYLKSFNSYNTNAIAFIDNCNVCLSKENSGYRVINNLIVPMNDVESIKEIETALNLNKLSTVTDHLSKALRYLSSREPSDYPNSIKESISAVESFCTIITGDEKATLGKALAIIEKKHKLHESLKTAFNALYGYTSDSGGIRHGKKEDDIEVKIEDAKFMLVACSAFINYLKVKNSN